MYYHHIDKNDGAVTVKVACAVVFLLFSFLWLFFFQADVMYYAQYVLSGGQTRYNRLWGAVLIPAVLWLLQIVVKKRVQLNDGFHSLTWLPSFLLLAVMTSVSPDIDRHVIFGVWIWLFPVVLVLWIALVLLIRSVQLKNSSVKSGLFSRYVWRNLLVMLLMIIGVAVSGNTHAVFHFRTHIESALLQHDYDEAVHVGQQSLETDSSLVMLRMYALSRKGELGERLFSYALVPSSETMLPTAASSVRLLFYPSDSLYRHLGAIPRRPMAPMDYLRTIIRSGQASKSAVDYLLCGYLLDRDLDSFVRTAGQYYTINDSLPRYYREALVLYNHRRSSPVIVYRNSVLDVDYNDFRNLEATCKTDSERRSKMMENYLDSYWYYYDYASR